MRKIFFFKNKKFFVVLALFIILCGIFIIKSYLPGKINVLGNTDDPIGVLFKMTAACGQKNGWKQNYEIIIDGMKRGEIVDCGSSVISLKPGEYRIKITGSLTGPDQMPHTVESEESIYTVKQLNKFILYPSMDSNEGFTITLIESCNC